MAKYLIFCISFFVLFSCGKEQPQLTSNTYDSYFPFSIGSYVDYEVVEVQHDLNAEITHDTTFYFLRTVIGDTLTDNEGRLARKFIRKIRQSANLSWSVSDVWTALIDENRVEVIEENQRKVWLSLPPLSSTTWDQNAFNSEPSVICNYSAIHEGFNGDVIGFDSVLTVEQEDVLNLVSFRRKYEQYANHVGLVNKYYKDLNILNFDTLNIQSGSELKYKCIGFGTE